MRLDSNLLCGEMERRRAVHSISSEQCHRRHAQVRAHRDQFLGSRSPFEEAECRAGMDFNVHQLPVASCQLPVVSCFDWELTTGNWQLLLVIHSFYKPVST